MRILIVSPFCPWPLTSGGHTRLFNVIKLLSRRHVVDLACLSTPGAEERPEVLERWCRRVCCVAPGATGEVRALRHWRRHLRRGWALLHGVPLEVSGFYSPAMQGTLQDLVASAEYDVVQVEFCRMAQHLGRAFFERHPALKVLSDYDLTFLPHRRRYECEDRRSRKPARYVDYWMNRLHTLRTWQRFDRVVVTSEQDRARALALAPGLSVEVVPNGVDLADYAMLPESDARGSLLCLGGGRHFPNVDGLFFFLDRILPRVREVLGGVTVKIVGAGWDAYRAAILAHADVELAGFVPDIRRACSRSDVMVVPLRIGGGTRLKILEAMALGIPVVSTSVGCEGLGARDGREVLVADEPEAFARRVGEVWSDAGLRHALTGAARSLVEDRYDWERLSSRVEQLYAGVDPRHQMPHEKRQMSRSGESLQGRR